MSDVVTSLANRKPAEASRDNAALRRTVVVALLVAVGYYLTATIGFAFALQPGSVSTLWMPNSILLAGLLLNAAFGWWWADPLAGYVLVFYALGEVRAIATG